MDWGEELRRETLKWLDRIEKEASGIDGDEEIVENIRAYMSDSRHFLGKGDMLRAFEAVVWAWAWLEIGMRKGLLRSGNKS